MKEAERKIYLEGTISGEVSGIVEGYLTESIDGSGVYDKYQAEWRLNKIGVDTVSGTINLNGIITYQITNEYPSTKLYVLQTSVEGTTFGYYNGTLNTIITHLRIADENNPYNGQGFSIISYTSNQGQGRGWTYDKLVALGKIKLKGFFSDPLLGIVSATLDETKTLRRLSIVIERIDLGLSPAPDLKVKIWGPQRVSPGQTVDYIIEYRNDGVKAAEEVIVFYALDPSVKYISASTEGDHNDYYHSVSWNLGQISPKTPGYLSVTVEVEWGLPWGTELDSFSHIIDIGPLNTEIQRYAIETFNSIGFAGVATAMFCKGWWNWQWFSVNANFLPIPVYGAYGCDKPAAGLDSIDVAKATPDYKKILEYIDGKPVIDYDIFGEPVYADPSYQNILQTDKGDYCVYFKPNSNNGLTKDYGDYTYNTVYAYSGGTRTSITAILHKNLKCKRLVLISPNCGSSDKEIFKWELEQILKKHSDMEIVIYQSEKDWKIPCGVNFYPGGEDKDWFDKINNRVKVNPESLDVDGKKVKEIKIDDNNDGKIDQNDRINKQGHEGLISYIKTKFEGNEEILSSAFTTIAVARDPNIKYGPSGNVLSGQKLDYKVEYENEGEGIAFSVYFTDTLDEDLNDSTLEIGPVIDVKTGEQIAPAGIYNPDTRTITWFVGQVNSKQGGYAEFSVNAKNDVPDRTEIINFATVYFPSVPEATRTNGIVSIIRLNQPPTADANGPYTTDESSPITFDAGESTDPDRDTLQYRWDFDDDGNWNTEWSDSPTAGYIWNDDYQGIVKLEVSDGELTNTATAEISVLNVAPVVEAGENQTVYAGNIVQFNGAFSDVGQIDTHIIKWDFGDGTTTDNSELNPSHIYYEKGVYTVMLTVEDDDGGIGVDTLIVDVQPIPAAINCDPNTLNLKSNGQWITCYIELPENYDVWQIDGSNVYLNGIPAYLGKQGWAITESNKSNIKDYDNNGILERMVKFNRQSIQEILELDKQTLTLTGKVFYNAGLADFEGKNIIRVTEKK